MSSRWFLREVPDVWSLLATQMRVTVEGVAAFAAWAHGDPGAGVKVRDCEHRADAAKVELRQSLRAAFATPIDAEDLYTLSERLDAVLNAAKDAVREAEVLEFAPDVALGEMADHVHVGVLALAVAFEALVGHGDAATEKADEAISAQRALEHTYRRAMSAVLDEGDLRLVMSQRELYRRMARIGDLVVEVAERVWYAVVKEG